MINRSQSKARVLARTEVPLWKVFSVLFLAAALSLIAGLTRAQETTISHGLSQFGELKYPADYPHFDYVNPDAPKGGEYSTWAFGTFDSMNPYITKGNAAGSAADYIVESLMARNADEPDSVYGLIAETIEYPADRSWAIFTLRPEARFSDGTQVKASDVVFTHYVFLEKGIPSYRAIVEAEISKVEAIGDNQVKFTFTNPSDDNSTLLMAARTPVLSEAQFENRDFADSTLDPLLGTGPYILESMDVGKQLIYVYNPDYWGADLPINIGNNNFERIRFEYYADPTAAFEGFKAGEFLFRNENSSQSWAQNYDFPAVENGYVVKDELPNGDIGRAQAFAFNLHRDKFSDPRVREAIGMAFNFEWSNKTLFFGLYSRVTSFFPNSDLEAKGMIPDDERAILEPYAADLPPEVFTEPAYVPPVSGENQIDRSVIRAAGKLLDEAGWTIQDGVRKNAAGEQLTIEFLNYSPLFDRIINPYIENLDRLGVSATNNRVDSAQYTERTRNREFDVMITTFYNAITPNLVLWQSYASDNANIISKNRTGLANPAIDALVDLVLASKTREELNLNTRALDRALRALHIWVPQWFKDVHTVAYWDVYDYPNPTLSPYSLGSSSFWWWDEEKAAKLRAEGAL